MIKKNIARLVTLGTVAMITAQTSSALDFDFSFTGNPGQYGTSSGTVTGEIFGLADNATSSATDVEVYSFPSDINELAVSAPLDATSLATQYENTFTVANGQITSAEFAAYNSAESEQLGICGFGGAYNYLDLSTEQTEYAGNLAGLSGVTFTPVAAPEPSTLALSALGGLSGLVMYRRRK